MVAIETILETEWNGFSNSEFSKSPQCFPPSFSLIRFAVREQMSSEDFKDNRHGGHFGYRNEMILAILNLHVAPMHPTKFWLDLTRFIWRCGLRIFKMAAVAAILDIGTG